MMQRGNKEYISLLVCIFGLPSCFGTCYLTGLTYACNIQKTNTDEINQQIINGGIGSLTDLQFYYLSTVEGVTLNFSIPENINRIDIFNDGSISGYVETTINQNHILKIEFHRKEVYITQKDFFNYFPNLESFKAEIIKANMIPFFTQNKNITTIEMGQSTIEDNATRVIDHTIIGGLDKLTTFKWENGGITKLTENAFIGTNNLQQLYLAGNNINQLYNCAFGGLGNLKTLSLNYNRVSFVEQHAFIELNSLTNLHLDDNLDFPLSTILPLKNLENLYLSAYNSTELTPEIFQQLPSLTMISLEKRTFNCSCADQWISKLSSYGITIITDQSSCVGGGLMNVDDPILYSSCQNKSYQCFNKSIVCPRDNWYRVDTDEGCNCTYPVELSTNQFTCPDIDECQNSSICQGNCINTPGSYKCDCNEGLYNVNETFCDDINECVSSNGNCTHNCTNNIGSYECSCVTGYKKQGFSGCKDIDECVSANGNCTHNCTNNIGSYECSCVTGYKKQGFSGCKDIDECVSANGNCTHNCTNNIGSYECTCVTGYKKQGFSGCKDIDECASANGNCTHNCTNNIGSYECSCVTGYKKQGFSGCKDIDECVSANGNCTHNCTNNIGSYECSCVTGYKKQGLSGCTFIEQCKINNGGCHHHCVQSERSYICSCLEGFKGSPLNTSHCEPSDDRTISELIFNVKQPQFYLTLMLALLFFITTVFILILLIVAILYFRRQLKLANSIQAPTVLSLAQLDKIRAEKSTVIKSSLPELEGIETGDVEPKKEKQT